MSGPISLKGDPIAVAWAMRWLAGEDMPTHKIYYCTICGKNPVDAENGYDTCEHCQPRRKPADYERRRPTTTEECEAAWLRYRAMTLMNTEDQLNADEQADHDTEKCEGWSV